MKNLVTKNKLHVYIYIIFTFQLASAQSKYFYYYNGNKVFLELDKSKVNLITNNKFNTIETTNVGLKNYSLEKDPVLVSNKFGKTEFVSEPSLTEFYQKIKLLKSKPNVLNVGFYFKRSGTTSIGTSNYFYVKLKNTKDRSILQNYCSQKNCDIVKQVPYMPQWYIINSNNTQFTSLELSNQFYESNFFADVDPAFMFNFNNNCANDASFGSLWGLDNTVNPIIDINACQAWNITQGVNVNVAVIDQGIDKTHNDLSANVHLLSYNTGTFSSPSQLLGSHGTHCAGTIAAIKDNNIQVVGVAPQSKLMDVSHSLSITPNISAELASGFGWAWQNGADVISNSWGDWNPSGANLGSPLLENSIHEAMILGRNNKGCIVVFATGNENGALRYPASVINDVLAVGSIQSGGFRSNFSNFGNNLDVVAPGSAVLSTTPSNQTASWNGTSMATPHVAGVAALILSINPCLTSLQVRNIIEQSSQKVGGYSYTMTSGRPNGTWNNQMGYGLVDAHAALLLAQSFGIPDLLYIRDGSDDTGLQPNTSQNVMWNSDDIWLRMNNDSSLVNEDPDYSSDSVAYFAKVKIRNKSCVASTGNEQLKLYWAKESTNLSYPNPWMGGVYHPTTGADMGGLIGTLTIPAIPSGGSVILTIPWQIPNPQLYVNDSTPWIFNLLARIEAGTDIMSFPETTNLDQNVRNNNNIAWKKISVIGLAH